jgi:hypothetical protein
MRPPWLLDKAVGALLPRADREAVLGDLCERYCSPLQFGWEGTRTAIQLVAARAARTFNLAVAGLQVIILSGCLGLFRSGGQAGVLGVERVDIVSHSYGGAVAAQFTLDHPERVRRIVFMDAGVYVPPSAAEGIMQLPIGIGRAVAWHAFGGGPWSINALACARRHCRWGELARVKDSTETLRAMMRSHRRFGGNGRLVARLPQLRAPALVIWGKQDRIIPVSDGRRLARETGDRLAIVKGAAHMPFLQAGAETGQLVRAFLQVSTARSSR